MTARQRTQPHAGTAAGKIELLLQGRYIDPDSGEPVGVQTQSLAIAPSLAGSEGELVRALGLGRTLAVVSDKTTHQVLGARVERALVGQNMVHGSDSPESAEREAKLFFPDL